MRVFSCAVAVAVTIALAGCGQSSMPSDLSNRLSTSVVSLAELASSGEEGKALARLKSIEAAVKKALDAGDISQEKAESIQAAIDAVRADLEATVAAEKAAAEKAAAEKAAAEKAAAEKAAAEKAAAEKAAAEKAANDRDDDKPGKGKRKDDDD